MTICTTCWLRSHCTLTKEKWAVWECSEFTMEPQASKKNIPPVEVNASKEDSEVKGLCSTCDLLQGCIWHRKDAVLFHCEHYQ